MYFFDFPTTAIHSTYFHTLFSSRRSSCRGPYCLLRSFIVGEGPLAAGLGRSMLSALERAAADNGATRLYLLTTTAESFFGRFGYAPLPRASAPAEITDSAEFRSLCPASAAFLFKRIC